MADGERTGRVGGDVFQVDPPALPDRAIAEARTGTQDYRQDRL
jgi:hypothetical protein